MTRPDDSPFLIPSADRRVARTLALEHNPTVLLVWAANRFNQNAARFYQDTYGISAMDWRMLVMLAQQPGITVSAASPRTGYDKGAVSRSLGHLESLGLATGRSDEGANPRYKQWTLTAKGAALHDRILARALERQHRLLEGFEPGEAETLNRLLRQMLDNLDALDGERP